MIACLFLLIIGVYLSPFSISFDKAVFPQWLVSIGKKYSLDIFIYHVMVGALLLKVEYFEQFTSIIGIVIFLLSWLLCIVLNRTQRFFSRFSMS